MLSSDNPLTMDESDPVHDWDLCDDLTEEDEAILSNYFGPEWEAMIGDLDVHHWLTWWKARSGRP